MTCRYAEDQQARFPIPPRDPEWRWLSLIEEDAFTVRGHRQRHWVLLISEESFNEPAHLRAMCCFRPDPLHGFRGSQPQDMARPIILDFEEIDPCPSASGKGSVSSGPQTRLVAHHYAGQGRGLAFHEDLRRREQVAFVEIPAAYEVHGRAVGHFSGSHGPYGGQRIVDQLGLDHRVVAVADSREQRIDSLLGPGLMNEGHEVSGPIGRQSALACLSPEGIPYGSPERELLTVADIALIRDEYAFEHTDSDRDRPAEVIQRSRDAASWLGVASLQGERQPVDEILSCVVWAPAGR